MIEKLIPLNVVKRESYKKFHIFNIVYWVFLGNKAAGRC